MSAVPSLRDFVLRSIDRPQTPRLRISQAGRECMREVYYSASGAKQSEPASDEGRVKMAIGSAFDAYALAINPNAGRIATTGWQFQVPVAIKIGGLEVKGTADAVMWEWDGGPKSAYVHCSDLKTVGSKTWKKVQKAPKDEHRAQVQLYAYGLGCKSWSVLYINADTGEQLEHQGVVDEYEVRKDWGLFEEVSYWLHRGEAPPRPYTDIEEGDEIKIARESYPCKWCSFVSHCWEETPNQRQGESNVTF